MIQPKHLHLARVPDFAQTHRIGKFKFRNPEFLLIDTQNRTMHGIHKNKNRIYCDSYTEIVEWRRHSVIMVNAIHYNKGEQVIYRLLPLECLLTFNNKTARILARRILNERD